MNPPSPCFVLYWPPVARRWLVTMTVNVTDAVAAGAVAAAALAVAAAMITIHRPRTRATCATLQSRSGLACSPIPSLFVRAMEIPPAVRVSQGFLDFRV